VAGLCAGPALATLFGAAAAVAPRGSATEAQSWLNSSMNAGAAAGAATGQRNSPRRLIPPPDPAAP
jgi:hypothetical protein